MNHSFRPKVGLVLIFAVVFVMGCSKNQPLSGRVTYVDDGSPVINGVITFTDGKNEARGNIDPDGHFIVGFEEEKNGIPLGRYNVYITGAGVSEEQRFISSIGAQYESPETSGLSFDVSSKGPRTFDITVERP